MEHIHGTVSVYGTEAIISSALIFRRERVWPRRHAFGSQSNGTRLLSANARKHVNSQARWPAMIIRDYARRLHLYANRIQEGRITFTEICMAATLGTAELANYFGVHRKTVMRW